MMRTRGLIMVLAAAGAAFAIGAVLARQRHTVLALPAPGGKNVRDAGPKEMRDPHRNWDPVDEWGNESFPASDPPGNY